MDEASRVARQYEAFAYPEPVDDLEVHIASGYSEIGDPKRHHALIWPEGRPPRPLRILAAGCGTMQAAYLALTQRDCEVVGVDQSSASLAHERFLQERHGLSNLHLYQGDLLDIHRLGQRFDHIVCTGVLHHLSDPDAGLRALAGVLEPKGTMLLMVYGSTARAGVYLLQDALRRLKVPQTASGVAFARRIVAQLPERHHVRSYVEAAAELKHDAAFVDTFLHPQDRAYTVPELLDLLARNGMAWQAWIDNALYYPDAALRHFDADIQAAVAQLPEPEQWAVVEMLTQRLGMHICLVRHAAPARRRIPDFEADDWPSLVPHRSPDLRALPKIGWPTASARYALGPQTLELGTIEAALLDATNGERSLNDLLSLPFLAEISPLARAERGRQFFSRLWRMGYLMFTRPRPAGV